MKKLYRGHIQFFIMLFLSINLAQANYPLLLPPESGSIYQALGLGDTLGALTWITTATNTEAVELLYSATSADTPLTLVLRDNTGSFAAYDLTLDGTETVAGNVLVASSVVGSVFYEYPAPASYAPIANTVQNKLNNVMYIQDFGGVGDGQTNNYTAFSNAFSYIGSQSGGALHIPTGNYFIEVGSTPLSLPSNCTVSGDAINSTILTFSSTTSSTVTFLYNNVSNLTLKNMSLVADVASLGTQGAYMIALGYAYNNFTLDTVEINGGLSNNLSTLPTYIYGLHFPALNTHTGTVISNCQFHNLTNPIINPFNSTQSNFSVNNTTFYNNYGPEIFFSGATGGLSNAVIQGCSFTNNLASTVNQAGLGIACLNGNDIALVNNYFSGVYFNAIRLEGSLSNFVVQGNIFEVDGYGILVEGLTTGTLQNGIIQGNSLNLSGTTQVNPQGISLVTTISAGAGQNILVADNIVSGSYYIGIEDDSYGQNNLNSITGNLVLNAMIGYNFSQGGFNCSNNASSNCTIGIFGNNGISVNSHIFHDCTTTVSCFPGNLVVLNPIIEFDSQTLTTYTTVLDMIRIDANDRLSVVGDLYVRAGLNNQNALCADQATIKWNGNSFSVTPVITFEPGALTTTFINNNGMLAMQIITTTTPLGVIVDASLKGMYTHSPF